MKTTKTLDRKTREVFQLPRDNIPNNVLRDEEQFASRERYEIRKFTQRINRRRCERERK